MAPGSQVPKTVVHGDARLRGIRVGGDMELASGEYRSGVDLAVSTISGMLKLVTGDGQCPIWGVNSYLDLGGAAVGSLKDHVCSWLNLDQRIDLTGFEYEHFVPFPSLSDYRQECMQETKGITMADRSSDKLLIWLASQHTFNLQPYKQLATVLRRYGYGDKADEIMIAGNKRRAMDSETPWHRSGALWVSWATIGFGYQNSRSLISLAILLALGTVCGFHRKAGFASNELSWRSIGQKFWYSCDRLIPLVELDKGHRCITPQGGARVYFYIHQLAGFVLVSLVVAGLTGLTR